MVVSKTLFIRLTLRRSDVWRRISSQLTLIKTKILSNKTNYNCNANFLGAPWGSLCMTPHNLEIKSDNIPHWMKLSDWEKRNIVWSHKQTKKCPKQQQIIKQSSFSFRSSNEVNNVNTVSRACALTHSRSTK